MDVFLIEKDDLLDKDNATWDKVSANIKQSKASVSLIKVF